jgi:hypothetical protein
MYLQRRLEIRPHLSDSALAKFRASYNLRRVYVYNINAKLTDEEIGIAFEEKIGPV